MNLKDEIRKLVDLQEIDSTIHRLYKEKDVIKPRLLEETKDTFEEKKKILLNLKNS